MDEADYRLEADCTNLDAAGYLKVQERMSDPKFAQLMHAAMGMVTEAGEFMDALKKHAMYGKPIDDTNLLEEIGDQLWYQALALRVLGSTFGAEMGRNIAKLRARFPHKFTEHDALNRDLDNERRVLESPK